MTDIDYLRNPDAHHPSLRLSTPEGLPRLTVDCPCGWTWGWGWTKNSPEAAEAAQKAMSDHNDDVVSGRWLMQQLAAAMDDPTPTTVTWAEVKEKKRMIDEANGRSVGHPGYRVGRHNDELIYWQAGDQPSDDDYLRYVVVSGPDARLVAQALNTPESQAILRGDAE